MSTESIIEIHGLEYDAAGPTYSNYYLWEPLKSILLREAPPPQSVLDIGCGNGATANMLGQMGYKVMGVDPSSSGIKIARRAYPHIQFEEASAYDNLVSRFGTFPILISLEVIEHVYSPRAYMHTLQGLLSDNGVGIISTPYHGYFKNLSIALLGGYDSHHNPLWDGGHIKFWSYKTLNTLLEEFGFDQIQFFRVGRIPILAKSMIAVFRKSKLV